MLSTARCLWSAGLNACATARSAAGNNMVSASKCVSLSLNMKFASATSGSSTSTPDAAVQAASAQQPHTSQQGSSSSHSMPKPDLFTQALQNKTEQQLLKIIEEQRAKALAAGEAQTTDGAAPNAAADDEEDDMVDIVNKDTGERYGPRGKEPTRFGDWEIKGRASDFA